jgi:hypothetical protein
LQKSEIQELIRLSELQESVAKIFRKDRFDFGLAPLSPSPVGAMLVLPSAYRGPRVIFPWQKTSCGPLRNRSLFGCHYLQLDGRETRVGFDLKTYPRGFGLSLKFFFQE